LANSEDAALEVALGENVGEASIAWHEKVECRRGFRASQRVPRMLAAAHLSMMAWAVLPGTSLDGWEEASELLVAMALHVQRLSRTMLMTKHHWTTWLLAALGIGNGTAIGRPPAAPRYC
jgi:hypothetical protein